MGNSGDELWTCFRHHIINLAEVSNNADYFWLWAFQLFSGYRGKRKSVRKRKRRKHKWLHFLEILCAAIKCKTVTLLLFPIQWHEAPEHCQGVSKLDIVKFIQSIVWLKTVPSVTAALLLEQKRKNEFLRNSNCRSTRCYRAFTASK